MTEQSSFTHLRNTLAELYTNPDILPLLLADAGIKAARVKIDSTAEVNWHNILTEAEKANRIDALLDLVQGQYNTNSDLLEAVAAYRSAAQSNGGQNKSSKSPRRWQWIWILLIASLFIASLLIYLWRVEPKEQSTSANTELLTATSIIIDTPTITSAVIATMTPEPTATLELNITAQTTIATALTPTASLPIATITHTPIPALVTPTSTPIWMVDLVSIVVTASVLNARQEADVNTNIITKLKKDEKFILIGEKSKWVQIALPSGQSAWVDASYTRKTVEPMKLEDANRHRAKVKLPPLSQAVAISMPVPLSITVNNIDFLFVNIPDGTFQMGSLESTGDIGEYPPHSQSVKGFWIGQTEVTNAQYNLFIESKGYSQREWWTDAGWEWLMKEKITRPSSDWQNKKNQPDFPVVGISWYEAIAYTRWLSQQTNRSIRLPNEAEWEWAARGDDGRIYPWGDREPNDQLLNYAEKVGGTTRVGSYLSGISPFGVMDMAGNTWEWTSRAWVGCDDTQYDSDDEHESLEGTGCRVIRGGS